MAATFVLKKGSTAHPRDPYLRTLQPVARGGCGVGLPLWPCSYQGVEAAGGGGPERQLCASLIEANGVSVLGVLALPVLLAGVGLVAVRCRRRPILVAVMVAMVAFCVLALASIGVFFLPAALVIAVVGWRSAPAPPPVADGPSAAMGEAGTHGPG
jgi:hypothetical protein